MCLPERSRSKFYLQIETLRTFKSVDIPSIFTQSLLSSFNILQRAIVHVPAVELGCRVPFGHEARP